MKTILHITADYPDLYNERKTLAIKNLLENTNGFRHLVYSINRKSGLGGLQLIGRQNGVATICYKAPPLSIFLETFLSGVADWIVNDLRETNEEVHLLHAHKLSIEGLVAQRVSRALGQIPYICTIRGNTDQKYLRLKLQKRETYRQLVGGAALLLPVTPWIERYVDRTLGADRAPRQLLPTISQSTELLSPQPGNGRLVAAFHLAGWRLKGIPNLLSAISGLRAAGTLVQLDIIGGGDEHHSRAIQKQIEKHNLEDQVRLVGAIPHTEIQARLNTYSGFVLPTLRETFGMVYIEALTAGLPILYSEERGVDGFFDDMDIGVRCNPKSVQSIESGLLRLTGNEQHMKTELARYQAEGFFRRFNAGSVSESYAEALQRIFDDDQVTVAGEAY
ncbi:glycosyltransferase [Ruegeria sp. Alg231-54]|uniref:glycosyltransferase n=1 Tax=Ruegeria sp. Alg231-54 TaxID=1922221 RepID=UPI00131F0CA3|nr:glycosyltransferase [Ruegeria sp. Alg231-54]